MDQILEENMDAREVIKEVRAKIVEKLDSYGKEYLIRQAFELWYVDELSYKNSGYSITGMAYRHNDMDKKVLENFSTIRNFDV